MTSARWQGLGVLEDHWPLVALRLTTQRLELRVPTDEELAALGDLAAAGVHHPGEHPYLTPWTDLPPDQRALRVIQQHWSRRGGWTTGAWALELAVLHEQRPIGWWPCAAGTSPVFQDNAASQGVSRKLGYRRDGTSRDVLHGRVVVSDRLRLDREDWRSATRPPVAVSGLARCLPLFGC